MIPPSSPNASTASSRVLKGVVNWPSPAASSGCTYIYGSPSGVLREATRVAIDWHFDRCHPHRGYHFGAAGEGPISSICGLLESSEHAFIGDVQAHVAGRESVILGYHPLSKRGRHPKVPHPVNCSLRPLVWVRHLRETNRRIQKRPCSIRVQRVAIDWLCVSLTAHHARTDPHAQN